LGLKLVPIYPVQAIGALGFTCMSAPDIRAVFTQPQAKAAVLYLPKLDY
jgi:hypothetical protein